MVIIDRFLTMLFVYVYVYVNLVAKERLDSS